MSELRERDPDFPRHGLPGLLGSSLAILLTTFVVFLIVSFGASLVAVLVAGVDVLSDFMARVETMPVAIKDPVVIDVMQFVGLGLYGSHAAAIWIAGKFGPKMPLARRVAWADWTGDRQFWWLLGAALAYGLASGLLMEWAYPESKSWAVLPSDSLGLSASLVLVCFVGPVVEELFFRGWIYTGMRQKCSFGVTLAVTSVLFALTHYEHSHLYALAVFPVGLALGFVRERYGSIKASAFFHGLYNLFSWVVLYFTTTV